MTRFRSAIFTPSGVFTEDSGVTVLARLYDHADALLVIGSTTSITRSVFDLNSATPTTAIGGASALVVGTVLSDTLTNDTRWSVDETGFNFEDAFSSQFTDGDHIYRVEYAMDYASGADTVWGLNVYMAPAVVS